VAYFKVVSHISPEETDENTRNLIEDILSPGRD
jgi:hypothetical protein